MKTKILLLFLLGFMGYGLQAQTNVKTLGVRLGGGSYSGAELTYQMPLNANRLEFDGGWGYNSNHSRLFVTGSYQWLWNLGTNFDWYAGPAASLSMISDNDNGGYASIGVGGQIGIQYNLNPHGVPFLISLDARPIFDFIGDNAGLGWGSALGVRYIFGSK